MRGVSSAAGALAALLFVALLAPPAAAGQENGVRRGGEASLTGLVVSAETGEPLPRAQVYLDSLRRGVITDSAGRFRLPDVPAGVRTVRVRLIGFASAATQVELRRDVITDVTFLLDREALWVEELTVTVPRGSAGKLDRVGFERRKSRGVGVFVTPEQIERLNPDNPSDLLRNLPGVRVGRPVLGRSRVQVVRGHNECSPMIYLDGQKARGLYIDQLRKEDVLALEVYRGASEIPAEFAFQLNGCGVVVVWTQAAGLADGRPMP